MIWQRTKFTKPRQIGWHSGPWSIYSKTDDGPCVLSSGGPLFFGPEHHLSVTLACERAEEIERHTEEGGQ